jgi:hypothetical protein
MFSPRTERILNRVGWVLLVAYALYFGGHIAYWFLKR